MAKIFTLEEYMKDENGEFVRKLKGGSEPEVKFSNLEKESSILEDEDSGEDEEEELSDAEFNMSELNGFLEKSNNERSQSVWAEDENIPDLDMAFWMESGDDDAWSSIPTQIFSQWDLRSNLSNYESPSKLSVNRNS